MRSPVCVIILYLNKAWPQTVLKNIIKNRPGIISQNYLFTSFSDGKEP